MKAPQQMTLMGLVMRILALKVREKLMAGRRRELRAEIVRRIPQGTKQMLGAWRIRVRHIPSSSGYRHYTVKAQDAVCLKRPDEKEFKL